MNSNLYENLYSETNIGKRKTVNRFVSQAMESNDGDLNGAVSERALERYRKLAAGGWGIVIVEALSIDSSSLARVNQMILSRKNLEGFKRLVHEFKTIAPESLLLFQISHSGRKANTKTSFPVAVYEPSEDLPVLTETEIEEIRSKYVQGALLAREAGADGVDFKLCHGYLGCEMLRPANRRSDRWGTSFENRTRFLTDSVREVQAGLKGNDFLLGSRISLYEGVRGGCGTAGPDELLEDLSEMSRLVSLMDDLSMDYINVSAGIPGTTSEITRPTNPSKYLYLHQMRYARNVKEQVKNMKVIGSAYSVLKQEALGLGEENIRKGYTDFVGWGRQSFADPHFPKKIKNGEPVNYCTACSGCSKLMIRQVNDGCIVFDPYYKNLNRGN